MKTYSKRIAFSFLMFSLILALLGCRNQMLEYYEDENNYIMASGRVDFINYSENLHALYIGFDRLDPRFDDTCFKIVGKSYDSVLQCEIEKMLQIGDEISFITAPKYFGDGYVMPIVAIWVDGENLLSFDEGFDNLLDWLRE